MSLRIYAQLLRVAIFASAAMVQEELSTLGVPIFGPTWDSKARRWTVTLSDKATEREDLDPDAIYSMVVFQATMHGEVKLGTCAGARNGVGCKVDISNDVTGSELLFQVSARDTQGNYDTSVRRAFVWDPERCLLQGEFQKFSKLEQTCEFVPQSHGITLTMGFADWPTFGVELEVVAREVTQLHQNLSKMFFEANIQDTQERLQRHKEKKEAASLNLETELAKLEDARKSNSANVSAAESTEVKAAIEKLAQKVVKYQTARASLDKQNQAGLRLIETADISDPFYEEMRQARVDAIAACWKKVKENSTGKDKEKLARWELEDDSTVLSVNEFSLDFGDGPIVDPKLQEIYSAKMPRSELDGIGVELVSPLLSGQSGADDLSRGLRALEGMGVQANPSGGLHVHINALNPEVGAILSLRQYISVLLGWVENQVAINRIQTCTRLAKPYSIFLYADQSPVKEWFPELHKAATTGRIKEVCEGCTHDAVVLLRELLMPELKPLAKNLSIQEMLYSGQDVEIDINSAEFEDLQTRLGWRADYYEIAWRPTFNYEATVGILTQRDGECYQKTTAQGGEQHLCNFYWKKVRGSIEFRQHSGTYKAEDTLRWVQFLSAFVYHYKQPEQVDRIFKDYLTTKDVHKAHGKLSGTQRSRKLTALLQDLAPNLEEGSKDYFSKVGCTCKQAGGDMRVVHYDPMNNEAFSMAQTAQAPAKIREFVGVADDPPLSPPEGWASL